VQSDAFWKKRDPAAHRFNVCQDPKGTTVSRSRCRGIRSNDYNCRNFVCSDCCVRITKGHNNCVCYTCAMEIPRFVKEKEAADRKHREDIRAEKRAMQGCHNKDMKDLRQAHGTALRELEQKVASQEKAMKQLQKENEHFKELQSSIERSSLSTERNLDKFKQMTESQERTIQELKRENSKQEAYRIRLENEFRKQSHAHELKDLRSRSCVPIYDACIPLMSTYWHTGKVIDEEARMTLTKIIVETFKILMPSIVSDAVSLRDKIFEPSTFAEQKKAWRKFRNFVMEQEANSLTIANVYINRPDLHQKIPRGKYFEEWEFYEKALPKWAQEKEPLHTYSGRAQQTLINEAVRMINEVRKSGERGKNWPPIGSFPMAFRKNAIIKAALKDSNLIKR